MLMCLYLTTAMTSHHVAFPPHTGFELQGYAKKAWQKERTAWLSSVKLPRVNTGVRVRAFVGSEEWVGGKVVKIAKEDFKVQVRRQDGG